MFILHPITLLNSFTSSNRLPWWLSQWRICLQCGRPEFDPWAGKIPWRRHGKPLQYSCLENPHGQRSLTACSPWGHKESDMAEQLSTEQFLFSGIFRIFYIIWKQILLLLPSNLSAFYFFSLLNCYAKARTSSTKLNRNDESEHPYLVPNLREKGFNFPLS